MKDPIIARTLLYSPLRRRGDKTSVWLDWNIVETSLGAMLEPASIATVNGDDHRSVDSYDEGFTQITQMDDGQLQSLFNTGGRLLFRDYNQY